MIRPFVLRYLVPIAAAVALLAVVGVPYIDRVLNDWFRSDVQLRARLVMTSIDEPLAALLLAGIVGTWIGASHDGTPVPLMVTMAVAALVGVAASNLPVLRRADGARATP